MSAIPRPFTILGTNGQSPSFTNLTVTGWARFADGTAAAPSIAGTNFTTTGLHWIDANTIGFTAAGTESLQFASLGRIFSASGGAVIQVNTGANASITLTPSGTGTTNATTGVVITDGPSLGGGSQVLRFNNSSTPNSNRIAFVQRSVAEGDLGIYDVNTSAFRIYWPAGGNTLLAGLTTNGMGVLQFPAATTSAGGITFGTDSYFYRLAAGSVAFDATTGDTNFNLRKAGTTYGNLIVDASSFYISTTTAQPLILRTNNTTALTLDSSQNTSASGANLTLGGSAAAAVKTDTRFIKAVTAIADATATTVLTVTVPNAAHSAVVRITTVGSLGAGGAIGANEASASITYDLAVTRTAGVAMNAVASTAYGSSGSVAVTGGATITITAAVTLNGEGVGVTNTASWKVTITKGSGSSANHTCLLLAEILNANASGITLS